MATDPKSSGLALYQYAGCPYCRRVRAAIERLGVEIELCDILAERERAEELLEATGRRTVPVLRIEEEGAKRARWLPESEDIIRYLEARFSGSSA